MSNKPDFIQAASGSFLAHFLPSNWGTLTEEELTAFMEDAAWEPLEGVPTKDVFQLIEATAMEMEDMYNLGCIAGTTV